MKDFENVIEKLEHIIIGYLPKIILALLILLIFYFFAKLVRNLSLKIFKKTFKKHHDFAKTFSVIVYFLFLITGIFLSLEILGLESILTKLIAGAGIIGIVAGFAFKDIASNAFAGFLLNIQRPFKLDDLVEIDSNFGSIKEIGWITTSIETIEGQVVFVPNQVIYNNTFTNYSKFNKRLVVLKSGVSYGDDLNHVKEVALNEVHKIDSLLKNEVVDFYFTSIGNSTYNFEIRFWIRFKYQKDYLNALSEAITRIKKRFEDENISISYPVTTLDFGVKGGINIFDEAVKIQS